LHETIGSLQRSQRIRLTIITLRPIVKVSLGAGALI